MKRMITLLLATLALPAAAGEEAQPQLVPVSAENIRVELKYFSGDNLVGERLDGYRANRCLLVPEAREALRTVAADLLERGLGLVVFDCYRPQRAVNHFVRWAAQPEDFSTKAEFYPREQKEKLFERGYIAARSGHSRGATVDLGLYRLADGELLNMGTHFDFMDERSATEYALEDHIAHDNRMRLRKAMTARGFHNYAAEWWHYTFKPEPWPDRYFDLPVE